MTRTPALDRAPDAVAIATAVCWIDGSQAVVATMNDDGRSSTCELTRGWLPEESYLAQVVRVIGDRERLLILGEDSMRLLLEREYVAAFHRPDRLVDVDVSGPVPVDELARRARALAG